MADSRDIKTLSTVEHIILRKQMYLGSSALQEYEDWIIDNGKISLKKISYIEGIKKILFEIIDNSVDEYIKTNGVYSTKINIEMNDTFFSCEDNGRGIPVKQDEKGEWMPYVALCVPMSGSNFSDDERKSIGTNGLGGKICSIFSSDFEATTCDGINKIKIHTKNNLKEKKIGKVTSCSKNGTKVSFVLDFEKFNTNKFPPDLFGLIKTRLKFLSWFYPKCTFTLNGEKINIKAKDISSMLPQPAVVLNEENAYICVYPSEEPCFLTYVNGIYLRRGGSHIDYIMSKLINDIRDKIIKKYKTIKPADIKNRIGIACFFKDFSNCAFDSQTKETLTNSITDISTYLKLNEIDLDKYSAKILKQKEIIDNITELFKLKEELAEKKELAKLNKTKKDIDSEKYYPPIGKTKKKYLMITEGFSAFSGISPILGRREIGYYMLKGKPMNIQDIKPNGKGGFMLNQEINELVNILGLDINGNTENMNYDYVVVVSDADADGTAIASLIITMFNKLAPKMIKDGRLCRLDTPLLIGSKGEKIEEYYFTIPDKSKMKKGLEYFYLKGLGSWSKSKFNQILEKEGGMEKLIHPYSYDKKSNESIVNWFGEDSENRKAAMRGRKFCIDKV